MRAFKITQTLTTILGVLTHVCTSKSCLTDGGASSFDIAFREIANGNVDLIPQWLSPNMLVYSDSLELLRGGTLNVTGARNPTEFINKYVTPLPVPPPSKLLYITHTCDTITSYWQIIVGNTPVRGINIVFVDVETKKITKVFTEINNGAARYAICKLSSTACIEKFKFTVGNDAPEYGQAGCQKIY